MFDARNAFNPLHMIRGWDDAASVRRTRDAEWSDPNHLWRSNINTLPDQSWDAFFGAIQRKGDALQSRGKRLNVDLVGRGGSDGIGTYRAQNVGAGTAGRTTYDPRRQALSGLRRAGEQ